MTNQPARARTHKPPTPRQIADQPAKMARWEFYGRLGSLRMIERILDSIWFTYASVQRSTCLELDPQLEEAILRARKANADIYARLHASHRNDWKKLKSP